jgi:hypothetical protein
MIAHNVLLVPHYWLLMPRRALRRGRDGQAVRKHAHSDGDPPLSVATAPISERSASRASSRKTPMRLRSATGKTSSRNVTSYNASPTPPTQLACGRSTKSSTNLVSEPDGAQASTSRQIKSDQISEPLVLALAPDLDDRLRAGRDSGLGELLGCQLSTVLVGREYVLHDPSIVVSPLGLS